MDDLNYPRGNRTRTLVERRCRSTGTLVALAAPGVEADEGEGWMTICRDHGSCVCHPTRKLAETWHLHPEDWCAECMALVTRVRRR